MNIKSITAVVIVAILIGVLYVVFENNFAGIETMSNSKTTSSKELPKDKAVSESLEEPTLIKLPEPAGAGEPITGSTNLLDTAESLEMRDYSTYFEELKDTL
jgi:cell division protein FtsN